MEGDVTALRLCLERVVPRRKSRPLAFALPPLDGPENLSGAIASVLQEVAQGRHLLEAEGRGTGRHDGIPAPGHGDDRSGEPPARAGDLGPGFDDLQQEGGR